MVSTIATVFLLAIAPDGPAGQEIKQPEDARAFTSGLSSEDLDAMNRCTLAALTSIRTLEFIPESAEARTSLLMRLLDDERYDQGKLPVPTLTDLVIAQDVVEAMVDKVGMPKTSSDHQRMAAMASAACILHARPKL